MLTKTMIMIAAAIVLSTASGAIAQNSTAWDNPPGSAWQDRGIIEANGGVAVLTPRGYRAYRPNRDAPTGAYAFAPQRPQQAVNSTKRPKQAVKSTNTFERNWFRSAEGPEWN